MTEPLKPAQILWKETKTPISTAFDDVYFSADNGMAESDFVFLQNNHLSERFDSLNSTSNSQTTFIIGETGFGSGLNFCNCLHLWRSKPRLNQQLLFISTECHPLTLSDLKQTLLQWPPLKAEASELIANYPPLIQGVHRIDLMDNVSLLLLFDDVVDGFKSLLELPHLNTLDPSKRKIDAWFLDGFAPAKNPDMWRHDLFALIARLSHKQTTLATFTAAGKVKRGLQSVGFSVKKVKGFGKKREMIQAHFKGLPSIETPLTAAAIGKKDQAFWPIYQPTKQPKSVAIIGAGIAGMTTAMTLAKTGFDVHVIDQAPAPLFAASGNPQAVIFPKFSHVKGHLTDFYSYAFFYAVRYYQQQFPNAFYRSGMLQLIDTSSEKARSDAQALCQRFNDEKIVTLISPKQASELANVSIKSHALYYANAGWVDQSIMRDQMLLMPNINMLFENTVQSLQRSGNQWQIDMPSRTLKTDAVIFANGHAAESLMHTVDKGLMLGTRHIRGQISQIPKGSMPEIQSIICHEGYLCPLAPQQEHLCLGASYDLHDQNPHLTLSSQQDNINKLAEAVDGLAHLSNQTFPLAGKVGFRCTTKDYLPIVGPVPDSADFKQRYQGLRHNKHAFIPHYGQYHPGLFLNIGLGSRGFTSAPISAEILKSYLTHRFFPTDYRLIKALHPGRFLIKSLIQNRIK